MDANWGCNAIWIDLATFCQRSRRYVHFLWFTCLHSFHPQRSNLKTQWRAMAFWASCSCDNDLVLAKIREANVGCAQDKEVVRPSTVREYGNLNVEDFASFNQWFLEQDKPTYKGIVAQWSQLRHRRWAYWHVMAADNPNVHPGCSMFPPLPKVAAWLGPFDLFLVCFA